MKVKCIIVEDERVAREGLQTYIEQYECLALVGSFSNAGEAINLLKNERVHVVFLDIEMPGMKGIEMAKLLKAPFPLIVFTTAYAQYALEGYSVNAVDYLVKPIFPEDFRHAVQKIRNFLGHIIIDGQKNEQGRLLVKSEGEWVGISPDDVIYLKSMQNYVLIYVQGERKLMVLQPLKELITLLPLFFIQVHRSYVINLKRVQKITDRLAVIDGFEVPMSRAKKKEVTAAFLALR